MSSPIPIPTPYDGSSRLFQIGVKPLGEADWLVVDERLDSYLDEKQRLLATRPGEVWAAEAGTETAQAEVLELVIGYLVDRHASIYRRDGAGISLVPSGRLVVPTADEPPLLTAARLVQEDLVLLWRSDAGWRVVAGSLSFPSSWSLADKLGRPMHEVHGPVPGFGPGTRNAELIGRMFDHLRPETPVLRWNWSLYGNDRLFHPETADPARLRFGAGERAENVFLRVERQTLRRLSVTGDIVFAIRIFVDPLAALEQQPEAARIAAALASQLMALDAVQLDYKGLTLERDRLVRRLDEIGGG